MDRVLHNEALTLFYRIFRTHIPPRVRNKRLKYGAGDGYANRPHAPYRITHGKEIVESHVPFVQAPGDETLFYCPEEDEIWSWNPFTGEKRMINRSAREAPKTEIICCYRSLSVSTWGQRIVTCCIDGRVEYYVSGALCRVFDNGGKPYSRPFHAAISPKGDRIAVVQPDGGYLSDEKGNRTVYLDIRRHRLDAVSAVHAVFSKSGRYVIVTLCGSKRSNLTKTTRAARIFAIQKRGLTKDEG